MSILIRAARQANQRIIIISQAMHERLANKPAGPGYQYSFHTLAD